MEKFIFKSLSAGFGFLDSGCKGENLLKPSDMEHTQDTRSNAGESEPYMLVAAVDFVIDDFAHSGRIHKRHTTEIKNGVGRRLGATEEGA